MSNILRCYFFGSLIGKDEKGDLVGLTGFAIPDCGIVFKSRYRGSLYVCQYIGLLSLLRFIKDNPAISKRFDIHILSDSSLVVYQIIHKKFISKELEAYYQAVTLHKKRLHFDLNWIPQQENLALTGLSDIPESEEIMTVDMTSAERIYSDFYDQSNQF